MGYQPITIDIKIVSSTSTWYCTRTYTRRLQSAALREGSGSSETITSEPKKEIIIQPVDYFLRCGKANR